MISRKIPNFGRSYDRLATLLNIHFFTKSSPAKELEVAHDVLVVHDHLTGGQEANLPVVVLETPAPKRS